MDSVLMRRRLGIYMTTSYHKTNKMLEDAIVLLALVLHRIEHKQDLLAAQRADIVKLLEEYKKII